jgi:hypothetical protein
VATVLLSDPDERSTLVLRSLLEALGHTVVHELDRSVDAAVIEPASRKALRLVQRARAGDGHVPVVCVSAHRRGSRSQRLEPVAFFDKPVPVGPFVRAMTAAAEPARGLRRLVVETPAAA